MKRIISVMLTAVVLLASLACTAFAYPETEGYIYDGGAFLDEGTAASVKEVSDALYEAKGIRIALCTVETTEGESSADYAAGVFTDWEVGHGVLILLVKDTNSYYAVQNNDLTEYLSNGKILEILDAGLKSSFEEKSYSAGVLSTVRSFSSYLNEKITEKLEAKESGGFPKALSVILKIVLIVALVLVAGYVALVVIERRQAQKKRAYLEYRRRMAREGKSYGQSGQHSAGQRQAGQRPSGQRSAQGRAPGAQVSYGAGSTAPQRRVQSQRDAANAATVQINTADIRAAMKNKK